jgi:predicted acylesterase/phospholipase RssA
MTKIRVMKPLIKRLWIQVTLAAVLVGCALPACASAGEVCVSYRGNGPKFPSLLGQTAALLEAGYRPRISVGGSSGANVAALVQALLENPTVANTQSGEKTAAQVLKASKYLLDAFIFLPRFDRPAVFIRSLITFLNGQLRGDRVAGPAEFSLAQAEHALAQVLLFSDFFRHEDFSILSTMSREDERSAYVRSAFNRASKSFRTSPAFLMRTLLPAHENDINHPEAVIIRSQLGGYLMLGVQPAQKLNSPDGQKLHPWRTLSWMKRLSLEQQKWARSVVWDLLRKSSFFPGLEMSEEKTLVLPSVESLEKVLRLESNYDGKAIEIPQGMIAHTTAFQGSHPNADNLRQFYFAGALTRGELRSQWQSNGGKLPVMSLGGSSATYSVIAPEKIWVAKTEHSLAEILRATIAEPLLFERQPIRLSLDEQAELAAATGPRWIANGGWLDTASYPLLRSLPQCAALPVVLVTPRDGINSFQKQALRGLLDLPKPQSGHPDPLHSTRLFTTLQMYLNDVVKNDSDRIILDFDWDEALQKRPQGPSSLRAFLFDASYHHAAKILRTTP